MPIVYSVATAKGVAPIHGINIFSQSFLNSRLTHWPALPAGSAGLGWAPAFSFLGQWSLSGAAQVVLARGRRRGHVPGWLPGCWAGRGGRQGRGSKTGQEEKATKSLTGGVSSCFRGVPACCHEPDAALGERGHLPGLGVQPDPRHLEGSGQGPRLEQEDGRRVALCRTQHLCFSFPSWKTGAKIQNHVTSPAAIKGLGLSLPLPVKVIWLEGRAPGPGCGGERGRISVRCQREGSGSRALAAPRRKAGRLSRCGQCLTVPASEHGGSAPSGARQRGGGPRVPPRAVGRRVCCKTPRLCPAKSPSRAHHPHFVTLGLPAIPRLYFSWGDIELWLRAPGRTGAACAATPQPRTSARFVHAGSIQAK